MLKYAVLPVTLAAALAVSNPGAEDHKQEAMTHVRNSCGRSPLDRAACAKLAGMLDNTVEYRDYVLFSTGRLGGVETLGLVNSVVILGP